MPWSFVGESDFLQSRTDFFHASPWRGKEPSPLETRQKIHTHAPKVSFAKRRQSSPTPRSSSLSIGEV
ncbi:MAG: hypothetical protein ACHBN1_22955 [Heteroscytonema crispum UTEX LB 1556]